MTRAAVRAKIYSLYLRRISSGTPSEPPAGYSFPIAKLVNDFRLPTGNTAREREEAHRELDRLFEAEWTKHQQGATA